VSSEAGAETPDHGENAGREKTQWLNVNQLGDPRKMLVERG
jgi:hypothetical protein